MRDAVDGIVEYDPGLLVGPDLDPTSYTGNARFSQGFFDRAAQLGRPVAWMIQETYSTRSQEGYQAGVYDARFAESRAAERGWRGPIAYVVSDGNGADRWSSYEYARGLGDASTVGYYVLGYGANGVLEDFAPGVRASAGAERLFLGTDGDGARWVPETWGPNNAVGQVVGPSPIPDTDLNHVHVDFGAAAPTPAPSPARPPTEAEMQLLIVPNPVAAGHIARLVDGNLRKIAPASGDWTSSGPGDEVFGVPSSAVDALGVEVAAKLRVDLQGDVAARVFARSQEVTAGTGTPSSGTAPAGLSDADVAKIGAAAASAAVAALRAHPLAPTG